MYKKITDGNMENLTIDASTALNLNIQCVKNFSLWHKVKDHEEVHIVMEGNPVLNIHNKFKSLKEGDILYITQEESYRYFSNGNAIIFCFK